MFSLKQLWQSRRRKFIHPKYPFLDCPLSEVRGGGGEGDPDHDGRVGRAGLGAREAREREGGRRTVCKVQVPRAKGAYNHCQPDEQEGQGVA